MGQIIKSVCVCVQCLI